MAEAAKQADEEAAASARRSESSNKKKTSTAPAVAVAGVGVTPLKFLAIVVVVGGAIWGAMQFRPTTKVLGASQTDVQIPLAGFRLSRPQATAPPTDFVAGGTRRIAVVHDSSNGKFLLIHMQVDKKHLPIENGEVALRSDMVELQGGGQPIHPLFLVKEYESADRGVTLCQDTENEKSADEVKTLENDDKAWTHAGTFDGDVKYGRNGFEGNRVFRGSRGMQITARGKLQTLPGASEPTNVLWVSWDSGSRGWLAENEFRAQASMIGWTVPVTCLFPLPNDYQDLTLHINGHQVPVALRVVEASAGG